MADGPILVTGAAGFIGFHVAMRLLRDGHDVVGLDNMNAYYDPALKEARRAELAKSNRFRFIKLDLADRDGMAALFKERRFPYVVHLDAQAGVRHSLVDPFAYVDANLTGFTTILEGCRHNGCRHLLYASSSSVYGSNTKMPFSVHENVDHPLSLYGASKKANELMSHAYAHLFGLPVTGLGRGAGRTWRCGFLQRQLWPVNRSNCSITEICGATLRMLTMWSKRSCVWSIVHLLGIKNIQRHRRTRVRAAHRGACTTSATTSPSSFWKSYASSRKPSARRPSASYYLCSLVMCRQLTPMLTI